MGPRSDLLFLFGALKSQKRAESAKHDPFVVGRWTVFASDE
jgi:hypothetical protein